MEDKELSNQDRLALITQMIGEAKSNYTRGGSFHFLLWGWVVLLANLGHYAIDVFTSYPHPYVVWLLTIPAGIGSGIYGYRMSQRSPVVSHLDRLYGRVWMAVGMGIVTTLAYMPFLNYQHNPVILLMAAIGTFISGEMLKFRPLAFGGVALAVAAMICFQVNPSTQYLVAAAGIFAGYLIPGYLLKRTER